MMSRFRMISPPKITSIIHNMGGSLARPVSSLFTSPVPWVCWNARLFGFPGFPGSCHGGRLISFLRPCFIIVQKTSQTLRIQRLRPRRGAHVLAVVGMLLSAPAPAEKLGVGGTGSTKRRAAGLRKAAGNRRLRRGKDGAESLSRGLAAAVSRHDGNGASAAKRRRRGRSASAGPRERRDMGSR